MVASGLPSGVEICVSTIAASNTSGTIPISNRVLMSARLHNVIEKRDRHLLELVRSACGNDDDVALGDLACLTAGDLVSPDLIGRGRLGVDGRAAGHERRLAVENIDDVGVLSVYFRHARLFAAARMNHVLVTRIEKHRAFRERRSDLVAVEER